MSEFILSVLIVYWRTIPKAPKKLHLSCQKEKGEGEKKNKDVEHICNESLIKQDTESDIKNQSPN